MISEPDAEVTDTSAERRRAYMRDYYLKNRAKLRERQKQYSRKYYAANREKIGEKNRQRLKDGYYRAYYQNNKEAWLKRTKAYRAQLTPEGRRRRNRLEYERRMSDPRWIERNQAMDKIEATRLRAKRGFTPEVIAKCLKLQHHACAICRRKFDESVEAHADHCHDTNRPRGMLCFQCNIIEGKLRKLSLSPLEFGQRLHAYLSNPPALT